MLMEELRKIHQTQPFQPFRVHMADGRKFEVRHPEFMYVPPSRIARTFVITNRDGIMEYFNILLVSSVEQVGRTGRNGGNGRRKRRG